MIKNKWIFLIDEGSSTLDCSFMGFAGKNNIYTLVDSNVYPYGIDNCVRQIAKECDSKETKIKENLFMSKTWKDTSEYKVFREVLANPIKSEICNFFHNPGNPKYFLNAFRNASKDSLTMQEEEILYCVFGGGVNSDFFMEYLTECLQRFISLKDINMKLKFTRTYAPQDFIPPTIEKSVGGRFMVALGLFEDVSKIVVNRMGKANQKHK